MEFRLPDFDLGATPIVLVTWHASIGKRVVEGDRLVEVLAGEVTIDLAAPATGRLIERHAAVDDRLRVGQLLAVIEPED
ncbi:MAG: lipoyl domain-containing protein [Pirellulaceae bacterium]|nr:lipoyl domain-containing protein [Pirellulaceae bacterium]